jgi:hypothetical protein
MTEQHHPPTTSQESPITVVGLGQCGSNVTLALSLAIDPLVIVNPGLRGLATANLELTLSDPWGSLRRWFDNNKKKASGAPSWHHDFYIADMNLQNRAFINELKIQAIRSTPNVQSFEQFLEAAKVSHPHLSFSLADKELYQQAIGRSQSQVKITPLVFEDAEGSAFVDGSGGLQFISEYLASTTRSMFSRVAGRDNGTLIGVFAAGGGTGAGAVLGALSAYKRSHNRYTLGVAILPDRHETSAQVRAGRFLVRYLSRDLAERPDTILMFSNEAGYRALADEQTKKQLQELQLQAREAVNWYLKEFLFFYTQINQPRNEPLIGKVFDPNDFRYSLSGTAFIGFSASPSGEFEPARLFGEALAPMRFGKSSIAGLAVGFGFKPAQSRQILDDLKGIMDGDGDSAARAERIRESSRFYGAIKQLCVFFFVTNKMYANEINGMLPRIHECLEVLTGGAPSLVVASYYLEGLPENAVMIIGNGGYIGESLRHIEAYIKDAFFVGEDKKAEEAVKAIRDAIQKCNGPLDSEQVIKERDALVETMRTMRDVGHEQLPAEVASALAATEKLRQVVNAKDFAAQYYVSWEDVITAASNLVGWAVIPKPENVHQW